MTDEQLVFTVEELANRTGVDVWQVETDDETFFCRARPERPTIFGQTIKLIWFLKNCEVVMQRPILESNDITLREIKFDYIKAEP